MLASFGNQYFTTPTPIIVKRPPLITLLILITRRFKQGGATFGPQDDHYADPTSYLRKNNKPSLKAPKKFEYTDKRFPSVGGTYIFMCVCVCVLHM